MSTNMTRTTGFYGTDSEVYYVTSAGKAWIVSSEDDLGTQDPVEIKVADIPEAATLVNGLMTPREAITHLRRIEAVGEEKLIEPD